MDIIANPELRMEDIQEGDILLLKKFNRRQTIWPVMENTVIVRRMFGFDESLFVRDYGGYSTVDELKGDLSLEQLFQKWPTIILIGNTAEYSKYMNE